MVTVGTGRTETIENRRNLFLDPRFTSGTLWGVTGGTATVANGVMEITQTSQVSSNFVTPQQSFPGTAAGVVVSAGYMVEVVGGSALIFRVAMWNGSAYSFGPLISAAPGVKTLISYEGVLAPEGAAYMQPRLHGTVPPGAKVRVSDPIVERAPELGPFFYGATPDVPPHAYDWAGTANASESIEWVTLPIQVVPRLVDGFEASREIRNVIHDVVNRSNPDVTLRAPGLRSGEFRMLFESQAEALDAFALLGVPQVFTISDPETPAIGMSFVAAPGDLRIELDAETRKVWWVVVPFQEVAP